MENTVVLIWSMGIRNWLTEGSLSRDFPAVCKSRNRGATERSGEATESNDGII